MNREECKQKIEKWKNKRLRTYCPLKNGMCRLDCECINMMNINESYAPEFTTTGGYCTCYMLNGGN